MADSKASRWLGEYVSALGASIAACERRKRVFGTFVRSEQKRLAAEEKAELSAINKLARTVIRAYGVDGRDAESLIVKELPFISESLFDASDIYVPDFDEAFAAANAIPDDYEPEPGYE